MAANRNTRQVSQMCEVRLAFQTSRNQAARIGRAAERKGTSVAEWLRTAAETRLKRQKIVRLK